MEPIKWTSEQDGSVRWQPVTWGRKGLYRYSPGGKGDPSLYRFKWRARLVGWFYRRRTSNHEWKKEN